jgi:hypothetical protein
VIRVLNCFEMRTEGEASSFHGGPIGGKKPIDPGL